LVDKTTVVRVMRAAAASGRAGEFKRAPRARPERATRPLAPDDDPDFLRELERRARRDDGSPT
jgi:hypothetical protein